MLGDGDAGRLVAGAGLNTDDRLPLEFSAPRALYLDTAEPNWQMVQGFKTAALPDLTPASRRYLGDASVEAAIGAGYASRYVFADALAHLSRALQIDPDYRPALIWSASVLLRVGQPAAWWPWRSPWRSACWRASRRTPRPSSCPGSRTRRPTRATRALAAIQQAVALQPRNRAYQAALQRVSGNTLR